MRFNLTIKKLLIGLVLMGVCGVLGLSAASYYSNNEMIRSQTRLTEIVMPLETANQTIRAAMASFIEREGRIIGAASLKELEELGSRSPIEAAFDESRRQLVSLTDGNPRAAEKIRKLSEVYGEFLKKDSEVLAFVGKNLELSAAMDGQLTVMDQVGDDLQKNAESITGRVNFAAMREKIAFREYFNTDQKTEELQRAVKDLLEGDLTKTQRACNDLRLGVAALSTHGRQILLYRDPQQIRTITEEQVVKAEAQVKASLDVLRQELAESPELFEIIRKIDAGFGALLANLGDVARLKIRWIDQNQRMAALQTSLKEQIVVITEILDGLQNLALTIRVDAEKEAASVRKFTASIIGVIGVSAIVFMITVGALIFRRIMRPIDLAVAFADSISKGDLTAKIRMEGNGFSDHFKMDRRDEISNLIAKLADMVHGLSELIGQVQQSGLQVTSSATELSATSKQQKAIMQHQMDSTHYVIQSITEISNVSSELVTTMRQVAAVSGETAEFASSGQADLSRMKEAIRHMEEASRSISGKLEAINEKAANITSVVTTITKVADQTNLLSLNAAIEAEKAGEYGRGFTVVAREIRRLADQTAVATLDIDQMVQDMQSAVSAGVMEMDAFMKEVERSAEDVARISTQLTRIIEQVKSLSPSFDSVNHSMEFQSERAHEISSAMSNLGREMEQTMESLKESFLAIEQLNEAARTLQDEVSRFKVV